MLHTDAITPLVQEFTQKAAAAAAMLTTVQSFEDAIDYCISLCEKQRKEKPTIAAPAFSSSRSLRLESASQRAEIQLIRENLRAHLLGVDIGLTEADFGIADTGTLVLNCPDENLRLSTMICDYHVCLLRKSAIVANSDALTDQLTRFMQKTPDYTAFITGPSRTADIERVLTIGVHGPLELHILLLEA